MKKIISLLILFVVANISYLGYCAENDTDLSDKPAKIENKEQGDPIHYYNLGMACEMKGDFHAAIINYKKTKKIDPGYAQPYNNLAWILATCSEEKYRDGAKAVEFAQEAVRLSPTTEFLDTLAAAYAEAGKFEEAARVQKEVINALIKEDKTKNLPAYRAHLISYETHRPWRNTNSIDDFNAAAVKTEAVIPQQVARKDIPVPEQEVQASPVKIQDAKIEEAVTKQAAANNSGPVAAPPAIAVKEQNDPVYYYKNGMAFEMKGDFHQAIINYKKAKKIDPGYAQPYNNLAWIMATCSEEKYRDGAKAVEFAQEAVRLSPTTEFLDTLAAAYAEAGQFENASKIQKDAIISLIEKNETAGIPEYRAHLISYETHRPWRTTNSIDDFKAPLIKAKIVIPYQEGQTYEKEKHELKEDTTAPQREYTPATTTANKGIYPYTILICSYKDRKRANDFAAKLREKGTPAFTCPTYIPEKGDWHRVFVGNCETIEEARKISSELKGTENLNPLEAKMPYAVQVGIFDSNEDLRKLDTDLQSQGYLPYSLQDTTDNDKSRLLIGAYRTEKDAAKLTRNLQQKGLRPEVVLR